MLLVFVLYILSVSLMKDIRRVFMYHGAEHKVINCYEHGLELNVENARKASRQHSRCGTTFMFFVIAISILVFALVNWLLGELGWTTDSNAVNAFIKLGVKLLFLPVIAGISYELLKLLAKSDCLFVRILRAPGMALQLLTTKEPTDDMLEVSLTAFKTVLAMDENPELPERKFEIKIPYESAVKNLKEMLPDADESDIDWILVEVSGKPRSQLNRALILEKEQFLAACSIAEKMKKGAPLQYALGYTEFYGLRFELSPDVLIPRPETETLVEKAVEKINAAFEKTTSDGDNDKANEDETAAAERKSRKTVEVLDLCTGSGAVGVSIKCLCGAKARVTASDISEAALNMARANALNNGAEIEFAKGDLFEPLKGRAFDFILVNPPYIPTNDLKSLDKKVRAFEPALALDGGADGLDFYRRIEKDLSGALKPGGALMAEFGMGQAEAIKNIFKDYNTEIIKDIEGADRIVLAEVK
jgi:release factor-specific protein-(glutamine-N5) methyltransferase